MEKKPTDDTGSKEKSNSGLTAIFQEAVEYLKTADEKKRNDRVLTTREAMEYLKTSRPTLIKMVKAGKLKANKIGREYRFLQEELDKYLRRG